MEAHARVGVDVGGTFTDLVAVRDGTLVALKTPSTPDAPEEAVLTGLERASEESDVPPASVSFLGHGTTVATNALLERDWADTALLTTAGFRDALEIGRQNRPDIYDLDGERPPPVVERDRRFEVSERLDSRGEVVTPLDEEDVRAVAGELDRSKVDSVAVCLLFSFENAAHERRVRELLESEGVDAACSLSSEVLPEMREYERTLATAVNAALKPAMDGYVGRLEADVDERGVPAPLRIMQSNGGVVAADVARERPVNALLSGPAAGVRGAAHVAARAGYDDVLAMDMGGTSCDVSLVRGGDPVVTTEGSVGDYPVSVPMVDVHTIGAGGGSVAWLDEGGALRVGPASAGADPGPICYGRGGTEPTVTDAHQILGRIDAAALFDDPADAAAVRDGMERAVADPLDVDVEAAAQGVLDVANANMERALRVVSVDRGHDPRELTLVAYGGAGPLHAPRLARELGVPRVLVPATAGVLSALGLLVSDVVYDYSSSMVRPWTAVDPDELEATFEAFEARGRDRLADEGFDDGVDVERSVDVRYAGQSFDLTVEVPDGPLGDALDSVAERFHRRHADRYGHASRGEPLELAAVRLRAVGRVDPPELAAAVSDDADGRPAGERTVTFDGEPATTPVYRRRDLPPGTTFEGPAVVEGEESTVVVHPDQSVRVDDIGNVVVES